MTAACHNEDLFPVESCIQQWLWVAAWWRGRLGQAGVLWYWPTVIFSSGTSQARCGSNPQQNSFLWTGPTSLFGNHVNCSYLSLWKPHELLAFLLFGRECLQPTTSCEELCCFHLFGQALFDVPVIFDGFLDLGPVDFLSWKVLAYFIVPYPEVIACLVPLSETRKFSIF